MSTETAPSSTSAANAPNTQTPVVFIPALLCDEHLHRKLIAELGNLIDPHVMPSPQARLRDSVADILAKAPAGFALGGTSYGGNLALAVALVAPQRVTPLCLTGCSPAAAQTGSLDLAAPATAVSMPAGLVGHKQAANGLVRWPNVWVVPQLGTSNGARRA